MIQEPKSSIKPVEVQSKLPKNHDPSLEEKHVTMTSPLHKPKCTQNEIILPSSLSQDTSITPMAHTNSTESTFLQPELILEEKDSEEEKQINEIVMSMYNPDNSDDSC